MQRAAASSQPKSPPRSALPTRGALQTAAMQNHYDILGVSKSASHDEIKAAYRKCKCAYHVALCMQTHPDVAGTHASNADKFKRISEAYSILSDHAERQRYDFETSETGLRSLRRAANAAAAGRGAGGSGSFAAALPRNLLIGSVIGFASVSLLRSMWPSREEEDDGVHASRTGHKKLVEAWRNPETGRWEKPRPWDPAYQKLQPALKLVPREDVHDGRR
ncbi:hypothetical protein ACHAXT_012207 [Thalassiosira profunda]